MEMGIFIIMLVTSACTMVVTTIWPLRKPKRTPQPELAREIRGAPRALPTMHGGEIAEVQALGWLRGVVDVAAFTLLETGHAKSKADAIRQAREVAAAWHGLEPDSIPWDGVPPPK